MKTMLVLLSLFISSSVLADGYYQNYNQPARAVVIMTQPIIEQIVVGKNCYPVQQNQNYYQQERSYGGAIVGGTAGALIGSRFGRGNGRDAAIAAGAIGGTIIGDRYDNRNNFQYQPSQGYSQQCQPIVQQKVTGYHYVAEYNGVQYTGSTYRPLRVGDYVYLNE